MSTKVAKNFKQYGIYRAEVYTLKCALWRRRVSQRDFARYLNMDPKNLSFILSGKTVPNAALWAYMKHLLYCSSGFSVLRAWLEKSGTSSLERFAPRCVPRSLYVSIECPDVDDELPF